MKKNNIVRVLALGLALLALSVLSVLPASAQEHGKSKAAGKSMTVTGCLAKGDETNEYAITENGKTYGLRSSKVDLSKHVGHQVSVTGALRPESKEEGEENEAREKNEKGEMKEAGDIRVSSLKMIKDSCQ